MKMVRKTTLPNQTLVPTQKAGRYSSLLEQQKMIKFCEPLYNLIIHKDVNHVFEQTMMTFARSYKIKSIDEGNHKIILDQTIPIYYTFPLLAYWIKEIIIEVKSLTPHEAELDIYGKYALSPHNIFLILSFRDKKIERRFFIRELEMFFEGKYGGNSKMF
jgi:hypothetical protein